MTTDHAPLIDADKVDAIMRDCLFTEAELEGYTRPDMPPGAVVVDGVATKFGFHRARLESHREEVRHMLHQLPIEFGAAAGGWSFLNMPTDRHGVLWGGQQNAEVLLCLGLGLGLVEYLLPKELWSALPGSVPYLVVPDLLVADRITEGD